MYRVFFFCLFIERNSMIFCFQKKFLNLPKCVICEKKVGSLNIVIRATGYLYETPNFEGCCFIDVKIQQNHLLKNTTKRLLKNNKMDRFGTFKFSTTVRESFLKKKVFARKENLEFKMSHVTCISNESQD